MHEKAADTEPAKPLVVDANARATRQATKARMAPYSVIACPSSERRLRYFNLFFKSRLSIGNSHERTLRAIWINASNSVNQTTHHISNIPDHANRLNRASWLRTNEGAGFEIRSKVDDTIFRTPLAHRADASAADEKVVPGLNRSCEFC